MEFINRSPTGKTFHRYLCPQRDIPADAVAVHGLTAEFLADKPLFDHVADEFLAFVGYAPLVAHNASFDIAFLNSELKRAAKPPVRPRASLTLWCSRGASILADTLRSTTCARYRVDFEPRYNVAPTTTIDAVRVRDGGTRTPAYALGFRAELVEENAQQTPLPNAG